MRIISQNGTINMPYESIYLGMGIVTSNKTVINAYSVFSGAYLTEMAVYTDASVAESIMEDVAGLDVMGSNSYQFPTREE